MKTDLKNRILHELSVLCTIYQNRIDFSEKMQANNALQEYIVLHKKVEQLINEVSKEKTDD